jgi:transcriptional regulator with XRE-family HTH domain
VPVFDTHLSARYQDLGIGSRITDERRARKITLRELAQLALISPAQLSNIETGKAKLNLAQLATIARALEISVTRLLPKSREFPFLVTRREVAATEQFRAIHPVTADGTSRQSHNFARPLAEAFIGKRMVPALAEIHPLADSELTLIGHHHEEFFFVLRGEVETQIKTNDGFAKEITSAGDCLYLRSQLPHCHRSTNDQIAEVLSVSCSRMGSESEDEEDGQLLDSSFYERSYQADISHEVAEKVALLRRSRRLTVQELAERVGVSARTLTAIEHGSKSIELDLLLQIAIEFKRPIESFFTETMDPGPTHVVVRRQSVATIPTRSRSLPGVKNIYRSLAEGFPDRGLHPYYVQVRTSGDERFEHHPGQEFAYVLEGEVELLIETSETTEEIVLRRGDSYFLDPSARHRLRGLSGSPYAQSSAEMIIVYWTPVNEASFFETPPGLDEQVH